MGAVHVEVMKSTQNRLTETRRQRTEALLEARIGALFRSIPVLCGFSVEADLLLSNIAIDAWPGYSAGPELCDEIASTLAGVIDERPDALELLRGRTFARTLQ
jgi:hypothetical protein